MLLLSVAVLPLFVAGCQKSGQAANNPAAPSGPSVAQLAVDQNSYNFPATGVGQVANSPMFSLSATGDGSLTVASVTSTNPAEFPLADNACIGKTLVVGGSSPCQIAVRFQPSTPGVRSAQVVVTSNGGGTLALDVFGSAFANGALPTDGGGGGGGGGSFPQAPCIPNTTGDITLTTINTTSFLVQLTFAGPIIPTIAVSSGEIQTLKLLPGNYTLSGIAPTTPNASFASSSWSVVNGCDYLLWLKQR